MFTSAENELQLSQNNSESTNASERSSDPCHQQKLTQNAAVPYVFPPATHRKITILPRGITRKEVDIIKLTAQFVAVYGCYFRLELENTLLKKPELEPHFAFLMKKHPDGGRDIFYGFLTLGYSRVLVRSLKVKKKGTTAATILVNGFISLLRQLLGKVDEKGLEMSLIDLHAFEYFVNVEYNNWESSQVPPREPLRFPSLPQGIQITHKELDIMKLTAQFVAVYGNLFEEDLIEKVFREPEHEAVFQFMRPADSRNEFYSQLTLGYKLMLLCSHKVREKGASTETLLEGYFNIVQQVLEREEEEGLETAIVDLHAFQYFIEVEYTDWQPRIPGFILMRLNPHRQLQYPLGSEFALYEDDIATEMMKLLAPPLPGRSPPPPSEEPEPKKQKFEESTLVPEDQFLAQHPGSSTIKDSVPDVDDGYCEYHTKITGSLYWKTWQV